MAGDNAAAYARLDEMLAACRRLDKAPSELAKELVEPLRNEIGQSIAAGMSPDGTAWELTKKGKVPLRNAENALEITATGTTVLAKLTGPVARHHRGIAKGGIAREILPSNKLPQGLVRALEDAASRMLGRFLA